MLFKVCDHFVNKFEKRVFAPLAYPVAFQLMPTRSESDAYPFEGRCLLVFEAAFTPPAKGVSLKSRKSFYPIPELRTCLPLSVFL